VQLLLREVQPDEVEQEVTQRDQFNTDEVVLAETLVREAHQNTMDGRGKDNQGPVRTRIQIFDADPTDADFWAGLLQPLDPHLKHCGVDLAGVDLSRPRLLVIEDFGTTGLLGAIDRKDERNFSDFWRRMGRSHKRGSQGGRWGLGKLVFSSASRIRTFFGLTIQEDDPERRKILMGQAVLKNHDIGNTSYAPHAFFGVAAQNGFQLPVTDPTTVEQFCRASALTRTDAPGLSIVVPCVQADLSPDSLLPFVIRNWFFPILTGKLIVEIGPYVVDANSFDELAKEHGGPELKDGALIEFIRELRAASETAPAITLLGPADRLFEGVEEGTLETLRESYVTGALISVRIPLTLRRKVGPPEPTYVDAYLKAAPQKPGGEAMFVRGAMTIPGEARGFRGRACFAALLAKHSAVAEFLGDAENPAHTRWTGTGDKVTQKWLNPSGRLREIRSILNALYDTIVEAKDRVHEDALLDFFSVKNTSVTDTTKSKKPVIRKPTVPVIKAAPAAYRIEQRAGGFRVRGGDPDQVPFALRIRVAYDIIRGEPLSRFSPFDFDLKRAAEMSIKAEGANVTVVSANELRVEVHSADFNLVVSGFDHERDLFVRADRR
jgi:hypothetical protein